MAKSATVIWETPTLLRIFPELSQEQFDALVPSVHGDSIPGQDALCVSYHELVPCSSSMRADFVVASWLEMPQSPDGNDFVLHPSLRGTSCSIIGNKKRFITELWGNCHPWETGFGVTSQGFHYCIRWTLFSIQSPFHTGRMELTERIFT